MRLGLGVMAGTGGIPRSLTYFTTRRLVLNVFASTKASKISTYSVLHATLNGSNDDMISKIVL